jgi:hypothetical protein
MEQQNKDTIFFQIYRQPITNITPQKLISLDASLEYTKNPPRGIKDIFKQIAEAETAGDKELKANLKQNNLHYFTPCVIVDPIRNYESINSFTGLLVLDFDHIENAADFKTFLFEEYKCIIGVWLSPSRRGVKALVKIPVVSTVEHFKEYYYGIAAEMEQFNGFDPSGQNAVLPLFQSYDLDLLSRDDPDTWTVKGMKRNDFAAAPTKALPKIDPTDRDKQTIVKIINTGFDNIIDYGHPVLRSLCICIGGYIGTGYISEYEAIQLISSKIETHHYLKKGIAGYKKTAVWALRAGQTKPITLNYSQNG